MPAVVIEEEADASSSGGCSPTALILEPSRRVPAKNAALNIAIPCSLVHALHFVDYNVVSLTPGLPLP